MALIDEARLLEQMTAAMAEAETGDAARLIEVLSDQPLATVQVEGPNGTVQIAAFMSLRPGAAPQRPKSTWLISSPYSSRGVIQMGRGFGFEGVPLAGANDESSHDLASPGPSRQISGLLAINAFRDPLREGREMLADITRADRDGDEGALRHVEERVAPTWQRTVGVVPDFAAETGARIWTGGAEAVVAHGLRLVLRDKRHRKRLRECLSCGPLYTAPGPGGIWKTCPSCAPSTSTRDEMKRLRGALREAHCPDVVRLARDLHGLGIRTVGSLRSAREDPGCEDAIRRAVEKDLVGKKAAVVDSVVAAIQERLEAPVLRGRGGVPGRGKWAFGMLELRTDPVPTDAEIRTAATEYGKKWLRKDEGHDYVDSLKQDALTYVRKLRKQVTR